MASDADLKIEIAISSMLRAGVSVSAAVVLLGAVLYLAQTHGAAPDYRHFHGVAIPVTRLGPVLTGVRHLDSRSVIRLGLLLLVATPILRVVYCVTGFAKQKDWLYALISGIVLCVLLFSLFRH